MFGAKKTRSRLLYNGSTTLEAATDSSAGGRRGRLGVAVVLALVLLAGLHQPVAANASGSEMQPGSTVSSIDNFVRGADGSKRLPFGQTAVEGARPVVYITFDGGPGPRTPEFLDALDQWDAKATFFVTGSHTQADPAMLARIVDRGHVLANHTWDHPDMSTVSYYEAMVQLRSTQQIVEAALGITMTCWRPPFGETNDEVQRWADEVGLTNSGWIRNGRWDVDTIDWDNGYDFVLSRLNTIQPNDVVLMHGGMNPDVEDLDALVTWFQTNGDQYRFEVLPGCAPASSAGNQKAVDGSVDDSARTQTTGPARPAPATQSGDDTNIGQPPTQLAFADEPFDSASNIDESGGDRWYARQRASIFLSLVTRSIDHAPSLAGGTG